MFRQTNGLVLTENGDMADEHQQFALSVVVPFYNEEESLPPLHEQLVAALDPLGVPYELVFVDDGSSDGTADVLTKLAETSPPVRFVKLRRNYGQTAAMAAGIEHARGDVLVTMDGDLQNDPRDIPMFLETMNEGYDLVVGWRHNRQDKFASRVLPSKIANWIIAKVTGIPIKDNGCSLKAYRADVIKEIPLYSEMHRFIPAMTSLARNKIAQVKVRHHARKFGHSKYGIARTYKVLLDLLSIKTILLFARNPMGWFGGAALFFGTLSMLSIVWASAVALTTNGPIVVAGALGVLFGSLAFFLLFMTLLSQLVYRAGLVKLERYVALAARPVGGTSQHEG
ncbi:MAG: glycosyltransferase family 2 protein [Geminicoccaceae bacterium]